MIPLQVMFISNYLVLRDGIFGLTSLWGGGSLLNSLSGVIAVTLLNASGVFIMKQFFETIPREVEEAAMLDGTTHFQRFWLVVMPMARPAVGALTILTFQAAWNDFFWPFIILTTPEDIKTLPIGLLSFQNAYGGAGDWGIILAGAIMSALPIIIIFFIFQKYFLEGVSYGGSKE
jgi:multiple sugar transport system permease protein